MSCPMCGGFGILLGVLGIRIHYRCRSCGYEFSEAQELSDQDLKEMAMADDPGYYGN